MKIAVLGGGGAMGGIFAIVEAGRRNSVPTPFNDAMVWMVKSLQAKYLAAGQQR